MENKTIEIELKKEVTNSGRLYFDINIKNLPDENILCTKEGSENEFKLVYITFKDLLRLKSFKNSSYEYVFAPPYAIDKDTNLVDITEENLNYLADYLSNNLTIFLMEFKDFKNKNTFSTKRYLTINL